MDWAAEGLLDGLEGRDRRAREQLLSRLHNAGASLDELKQASENETLIFLGADRQVGGAKYTVGQLAEQAGIDEEFVRRSIRATGLAIPAADEAAFGELHLDLAKIGAVYRKVGLDDGDLLEVTRLLARGLAPVAETMRELALKLALKPGASEDDLSIDFAQVADQLMPSVEPLLAKMMRIQLQTMVRSEAINTAEREAGKLPGAREVAVCFADLVGFTRAGEELPADELGDMANRLERLAAEHVALPVRIVKSIGDAVMLVSPEVEPMVEAALNLVGATEDEGSELPPLRVGIAQGQALRRASDWFGRPVNLASRITAVARPGSVLVDETVCDAIQELDRYRISRAGSRRLKGIKEPVVLHRVRFAG